MLRNQTLLKVLQKLPNSGHSFSSILLIITLFTILGGNYVLISPINETAVISTINSDIKRIIADDVVNFTILHINDLHGWLNPHDGYGGVATYMTNFRNEGFTPDNKNSSYLLLSGGDQNTGPAVATLTKGEAVVDVMNAMGFTAAAIGNHEFDYGIEWMEKRQAQANYPLLSANIFEKDSTTLANFTIPWVIQNHSGVNIGIIGLTTTSTYTSAHPKITQYFEFGDYETALRKYVPEMRTEGAEIIISLTHIPPNTLGNLASEVSDLNIDLFLGGHSGGGTIFHESSSLIASAEHYSQQYAKIILSYDKETSQVLSSSGTLIDNIEGVIDPDPTIQEIVDEWVEFVDADRVITYTSEDIYDEGGDSGIGALITDSFLYYFNYSYNFGLANRGGGFRDYFREGNITLADIVSVVPFENNLLSFSMTGKEIKDEYPEFLDMAHGGLKQDGDSLLIFDNGEFKELISSKIYKGIILDYPWYVSYKNSFNTVDTGVHYRDAIVYYFEHLEDLSDHTSENRLIVSLPFTSQSITTTSQSTGMRGLEPLLALLFVVYFLPVRNKKPKIK